MPDPLCCIHAYVTGRVQGVWFRGYTKAAAKKAGVTGWAKNLSDGRVEVMLCGAEDAVAKVVQAIHKGPPLAKVVNVEQETLAFEPFEGFITG